MSIHKTKNGKWEVRWRYLGSNKSKTFPSWTLAKEFDRDLGKDEKDEVKAHSTTFKEFSARWLKEYCAIEKTETQWKTDESVIRLHLVPYIGTKSISDLKAVDLVAVKIKLTEKKLAPKSINNILGIAKTILETAVEWDLLATNPFRRVKLAKKVQQPYAYWSTHEIDRFLSHSKVHDLYMYEVVSIAIHTGMRRGEILALRRDQLDFEKRLITVSRNYDETLKKDFDFTKTRQIRHVPMNDHVYSVLLNRKLWPATERIFDRRYRQLFFPFKRLCRESNVKPIRFHDLRHTFASHLVMNGVAIESVSKLLGHHDITMTMRYAHLSNSHLLEATNVLVRKTFGENERKFLNIVND